jgi:hypothetical protein
MSIGSTIQFAGGQSCSDNRYDIKCDVKTPLQWQQRYVHREQTGRPHMHPASDDTICVTFRPGSAD